MIILSQSEELPYIELTWYDRDGSPIDFSTQSHTFQAKVLDHLGKTITKTEGFTGYSVSPNLRIEFSSEDDIPHLEPGEYLLELTATNNVSDKSYKRSDQLIIRPGI